MDQYAAVAVGAFAGMLWPFVVALWKNLAPNGFGLALEAVPSVASSRATNAGRFLGWLLIAVFIAAAIAALNIVPLVTGDAGDKLAELGNWQYAFLGAEGFGLASFVEEGLKK